MSAERWGMARVLLSSVSFSLNNVTIFSEKNSRMRLRAPAGADSDRPRDTRR